MRLPRQCEHWLAMTRIFDIAVQTFKLQATSKNSFLRIWAEDFDPEKVLETPEYFVYCGVFKTYLWVERFAQIPKGEFLEVPYNLTAKYRIWEGGVCPEDRCAYQRNVFHRNTNAIQSMAKINKKRQYFL